MAGYVFWRKHLRYCIMHLSMAAGSAGRNSMSGRSYTPPSCMDFSSRRLLVLAAVSSIATVISQL